MKTLFLSIIGSIVYFLYSIPYENYVVRPEFVISEKLSVNIVPELEPIFSEEDVRCLQENIFFEAATEDLEGQIAVGLVTLNRVSSDRFPNSVCGVVKQAYLNAHGVPVRNQCQFSWYCDGKSDKPNLSNNYDREVWEEVGALAYHLLHDDHGYDHVGESLFYHVEGIAVPWADAFDEHSIVGSHVFYTMN